MYLLKLNLFNVFPFKFLCVSSKIDFGGTNKPGFCLGATFVKNSITFCVSKILLIECIEIDTTILQLLQKKYIDQQTVFQRDTHTKLHSNVAYYYPKGAF